ncbi:hypothetical protein Tco_0516210 [Tanacetum coccineum]
MLTLTSPQVSVLSLVVNVASPHKLYYASRCQCTRSASALAFMVENRRQWFYMLLHQDLEQIHEDDLEAMDLKWQLFLLSVRTKKYYQRTGKKIFFMPNDTAGGYENLRWRRTCSDKLALMCISDSEFQKPGFKGYGPVGIVSKELMVVCDKESDNSKKNSDESLVEEQVSQNKNSFVESSPNVDKETVFPVNKKVEFTKPENQEKPVKKSVRASHNMMIKDLLTVDAHGNNDWNIIFSHRFQVMFEKKVNDLGSQCLTFIHSPKFAEMHNVVAFLEKPKESDGFAEIIDFLKASFVSYALTVNPFIYTSCIEQFWATAKVQTVNGVRQLQALVDKKRVIVTESSIRRDLYLDDAEGTDCLPTATIFEELARMGYEKPSQKLTFYKSFFSPQWKYFIHTITQCLCAKSTAWNEFSSSMASLIICLATNQKFNLSKYIFDAMVKHLDGRVKFLLAGKDFSGIITPLFDTMMVQPVEEMGEASDHPTNFTPIHIIDQPFSSSQHKKKQPSKKAQRQEAEVPQDEAEHEESIPTPFNDPQPSSEDSMQLTDLMVLCTKLQTQVLDLQKAKDA